MPLRSSDDGGTAPLTKRGGNRVALNNPSIAGASLVFKAGGCSVPAGLPDGDGAHARRVGVGLRHDPARPAANGRGHDSQDRP